MTIEGSECTKCGYKTLSVDVQCPRCEHPMVPKKFGEAGKVLSFVPLNQPPHGMKVPLNLAMVEIDDGPQLVCWTSEKLKSDQKIEIVTVDGVLHCTGKPITRTKSVRMRKVKTPSRSPPSSPQ